ncbi:MAG: DUF4430 domain-containing protein [Candidatus Pacebacteria bacterium]|nr:DUF4430 domain-containing protein [Candidatus Paceibacterota bacterium]
MSPKTKILLSGFGIIGFNMLVLVLFVMLPVEQRTDTSETQAEQRTFIVPLSPGVKRGGEESPELFDVASTSDQTLIIKNLGTTPEVRAVPLPTSKNDTTQANGAEVDTYRVPVYTEGTVLSAMEAYRDTGVFTFSGRDFPGIGFFIDTVQGRKATDTHFWILYVNGRTSNVGVSQARVKQGDVVEWKYEDEYMY